MLSNIVSSLRGQLSRGAGSLGLKSSMWTAGEALKRQCWALTGGKELRT